jgi:hypothetical protein
MPEELSSQTETFAAAAAPSANPAAPMLAANDQIAAPDPLAKVAYLPPMLRIGGLDERGNTVKYIYAIDPNYVVYYSRLERRNTGANDTDLDETPRRGLMAWIKSLLRLSGPAYEREGVQVQPSSDPRIRAEQLRKLLPLGTARAKLRALLSGWPRRESYDSSIATALQLALDGNGDEQAQKTALATLEDARASMASEREIAGRGQWVTFALVFGILGFELLGLAQHNLFHHTGYFWLGAQAGLLGAIFSIAIGISSRTVAPNTNVRSNLTDSVVRLVIGAISGGTIVLVTSIGLIPQLRTSVGELTGDKSIQFVLFLGIIAGFVERLVPGILDDQGRKLGGETDTKSSDAVAKTK